MKKRITLLWILLAFVLLSTSAAALSGARTQVDPRTIAGGDYRLTTLGPQPQPVAAGGAYRLLEPLTAELHGSGCCCSYLPCVIHKK
jgi:hypothetical protein